MTTKAREGERRVLRPPARPDGAQAHRREVVLREEQAAVQVLGPDKRLLPAIALQHKLQALAKILCPLRVVGRGLNVGLVANLHSVDEVLQLAGREVNKLRVDLAQASEPLDQLLACLKHRVQRRVAVASSPQNRTAHKTEGAARKNITEN